MNCKIFNYSIYGNFTDNSVYILLNLKQMCDLGWLCNKKIIEIIILNAIDIIDGLIIIFTRLDRVYEKDFWLVAIFQNVIW